VKARNFSGAEIEQAIIASIFESAARAPHVGKAELTQADIMHELERTRPLSVVMAERIGRLRAWAHDRAVLADDNEI
jgi:hypothetical protein